MSEKDPNILEIGIINAESDVEYFINLKVDANIDYKFKFCCDFLANGEEH